MINNIQKLLSINKKKEDDSFTYNLFSKSNESRKKHSIFKTSDTFTKKKSFEDLKKYFSSFSVNNNSQDKKKESQIESQKKEHREDPKNKIEQNQSCINQNDTNKTAATKMIVEFADYKGNHSMSDSTKQSPSLITIQENYPILFSGFPVKSNIFNSRNTPKGLHRVHPSQENLAIIKENISSSSDRSSFDELPFPKNQLSLNTMSQLCFNDYNDNIDKYRFHCTNMSPQLLTLLNGDLKQKITEYENILQKNKKKWIPPKKPGLNNSNRIIPHYYFTNKPLIGQLFKIDYYDIIKDDIKNLRPLTKYEIDYIELLDHTAKIEIIQLFNESMQVIIRTFMDYKSLYNSENSSSNASSRIDSPDPQPILENTNNVFTEELEKDSTKENEIRQS